MNEFEPILTIVVNLIVSLLVSKGIVDSVHAPMVSQEINNILAAIVTISIGTFGLYKYFQSRNHKITVDAQLKSGTMPVAVTVTPTVPATQTSQVTLTHTGLPSPVTKG